jgi:Zn-finger nucleic acid-binding protein
MKCPKCRNTDLKPTKIEDGLPVMGCPDCEGASLSLLYYRDWAERNEPVEQNDSFDADVTVENDAKTALSCPKCSKLMTKYSVSSEHRNRIDLCGFCDEAWLDGSEWTLLKSLELAHKLPTVFTDQWQRKVRDEKMESKKVDRLKRLVGESDTAKAVEVRDWLRNHERKMAIVQFIGSE